MPVQWLERSPSINGYDSGLWSGAICGLSLLFLSRLAPGVFPLGTLVFLLLQKPTSPNSNSTKNRSVFR